MYKYTVFKYLYAHPYPSYTVNVNSVCPVPRGGKPNAKNDLTTVSSFATDKGSPPRPGFGGCAQETVCAARFLSNDFYSCWIADIYFTEEIRVPDSSWFFFQKVVLEQLNTFTIISSILRKDWKTMASEITTAYKPFKMNFLIHSAIWKIYNVLGLAR